MLDGIGFFELALVFVIALLVLGPEQLPACLSRLQAMRRDFMQATQSLNAQLQHDIKTEQLHTHLKEAESSLSKHLSNDVIESVNELKASASSVTRPYKNTKSSEGL